MNQKRNKGRSRLVAHITSQVLSDNSFTGAKELLLAGTVLLLSGWFSLWSSWTTANGKLALGVFGCIYLVLVPFSWWRILKGMQDGSCERFWVLLKACPGWAWGNRWYIAPSLLISSAIMWVAISYLQTSSVQPWLVGLLRHLPGTVLDIPSFLSTAPGPYFLGSCMICGLAVVPYISFYRNNTKLFKQ